MFTKPPICTQSAVHYFHMSTDPHNASQFNRNAHTPNTMRPLSFTLNVQNGQGQPLTIQHNKSSYNGVMVQTRTPAKPLSVQLNHRNNAPTITIHPRSSTPQSSAPSQNNLLVQPPPQHAREAITVEKKAATPSRPAPQPQPVPPPAQSQTQSPAYNQMSLNSFVSSFEYGKTFNETDLSTLGLDLKCQEPFLPMLHSVLSDAPLLERSCYPIPECYSNISPTGAPEEKMSLFSEQTLLFIFYTNQSLQEKAANELEKKGYTYSQENEEWRTPEGYKWSVEQWKVIDESQKNNED